MDLLFTKGSGKYDTMTLLRPDGSTAQVPCPKQGIIPHDMVHFAVERSLQRRGFLQRVKDGEAADFRMAPEAESDAIERLVEAVQGDAWSGGHATEAEVLAMYRLTCEARGCAALALDAPAIRDAIAELTRAWQAVPVHGSLRLTL